MAAPPLTVAILAGGQASRLGGRDKGLEPLGGRPLIAWVVDAVHKMDEALKPSPPRGEPGFRLLPSGSDRRRTAAQGWLDRARERRMREGWGGDGVDSRHDTRAASELLIVANRNLDDYAKYARTIPDATPGFRGPLAGVAAALAACSTPWLLTVPIDCPAPPIDLTVRLVEAAQTDDADACVAHDGERRQPLFALYRSRLATSAARAAEAGQGVRQWQTAIGARELDFADRRLQFLNLNTAEDFAAYAAEHGLAS